MFEKLSVHDDVTFLSYVGEGTPCTRSGSGFESSIFDTTTPPSIDVHTTGTIRIKGPLYNCLT